MRWKWNQKPTWNTINNYSLIKGEALQGETFANWIHCEMFKIWPFQTFGNSLTSINWQMPKRSCDKKNKRNIIINKIYCNNKNQLPDILSYSVILGTPWIFDVQLILIPSIFTTFIAASIWSVNRDVKPFYKLDIKNFTLLLYESP